VVDGQAQTVHAPANPWVQDFNTATIRVRRGAAVAVIAPDWVFDWDSLHVCQFMIWDNEVAPDLQPDHHVVSRVVDDDDGFFALYHPVELGF
jgi:hypothetical protein